MKTNQMNQTALHILFILASCMCLAPVLLVFASSLTEENSIIMNGYSFWPSDWSFAAYEYLFKASNSITHSYGISLLVTVMGTGVGVLISCMLAYPLSRRDMPLRSLFSFLVFFTMLFNGGLVSTYLVYTNLLDIKNTIWALMIPGLLTNGFFILIFRTFFMMSIPKEVLESAYMDGASEVKIFFRIVIPLSLPVIATIGLMQSIGYWNDWFNGMIYVTNPKLFTIQNLLNRMMNDIQFLQSTNLGTNSVSAGVRLPTETLRMAMAVVGLLPIVLAYPFFQRYLVKGLTLGAVKG